MRHYDRHHTGSGGVIAAFLAGVATAVAVGGYLLYGPHGKENRERVERWMLTAKAEILDKMDKAGDVTEDQYHKIVDEVTGRYAGMKDIGRDRAARAAEGFKRRWEEMRAAARRARDEAQQELEDEERRRNL